MRGVLRAFTQRALRSYGAVGLSVSSLKIGGRVEILGFTPKGDPISLVANDVRAGRLGSLRLAQRIVAGFVQSLNFVTVEALIPNLQPNAERSGRAQVLDCITDGLSRSCETAIFGAAGLHGLGQE